MAVDASTRRDTRRRDRGDLDTGRDSSNQASSRIRGPEEEDDSTPSVTIAERLSTRFDGMSLADTTDGGLRRRRTNNPAQPSGANSHRVGAARGPHTLPPGHSQPLSPDREVLQTDDDSD